MSTLICEHYTYATHTNTHMHCHYIDAITAIVSKRTQINYYKTSCARKCECDLHSASRTSEPRTRTNTKSAKQQRAARCDTSYACVYWEMHINIECNVVPMPQTYLAGQDSEHTHTKRTHVAPRRMQVLRCYTQVERQAFLRCVRVRLINNVTQLTRRGSAECRAKNRAHKRDINSNNERLLSEQRCAPLLECVCICACFLLFSYRFVLHLKRAQMD